MPEFLVLRSSRGIDITFAEGQRLTLDAADVSELRAAGVVFVDYSDVMQPIIDAFFAQQGPVGGSNRGSLTDALLAAGVFPGIGTTSARYHQVTPQPVLAVDTPIAFDAVTYDDTDGLITVGAGNTEFTLQATGRWAISGQVASEKSSGNTRTNSDAVLRLDGIAVGEGADGFAYHRQFSNDENGAVFEYTNMIAAGTVVSVVSEILAGNNVQTIPRGTRLKITFEEAQ